MIAAAGDDCIIRLYKLNTTDFKSSEKMFEMNGHHENVNCLDFSQDDNLLISSSVDKNCFIFNLKQKGQRIQKLTFMDSTFDRNMQMRGCFFSKNGKFIYTLCSQIRNKSYLVQWDSKSYSPLNILEAHSQLACGLKQLEDGSKASVISSDGFVNIINLNT